MLASKACMPVPVVEIRLRRQRDVRVVLKMAAAPKLTVA